MLTQFRKFALRGNVVDLMVGFTVGAAFTTVARSLVDDLIMPPIGLLFGRVDFSDLYVLLKAGAAEAPPYPTLADAQAAGAVTLNYGRFINNIITFLIVALAVFIIIQIINGVEDRLEEESGHPQQEPQPPTHKKCPYCLTTIPYKATRCPQCTSQLEPGPAVD